MEPLKDLLSAENAKIIGKAIAGAHEDFSLGRFQRGLAAALEPLELKPRVLHLADRLSEQLPQDPRGRFAILVRGMELGDLRGFLVWPLTEIVARHGEEPTHFKPAMDALREMTRRFTAEFAIRPFLKSQPQRTLELLGKWCANPCEHVRRLVSEGTRPFLPWGGNLPEMLEEPFPTLGLLDQLHADPSDYVRLSVSNHLNDLSKRHPDLVIGLLKKWREAAPADLRLEKLSRHACRTLIKAGHPGALALHGYGSTRSLVLEDCTLSPRNLVLGGALEYRLRIRNTSTKAQKVLFDYAIHHRKANGTLSPKVFKGRSGIIEPRGVWEIQGRHVIRPVTTRVYHAGLHRFEPLINGRAHPALEFHLR
jgi:3-methyladenine DNA glycosylase AlkC